MKTFLEWVLRCFDTGIKLLKDSFNQIAIIQVIQYLENDDSSSIISRRGLQILNEREKMLDLSKLENQLDQSLKNETNESLNEWIQNKRDHLNISDVSDSNSISGLVFGIDGETIQLTKYKKNWHKIFDEHKIDKKYKTRENFEHFCYLNYIGIDAEAVFVEKIRELETE